MSAAQPLPAMLQALSNELVELHIEANALQDVFPATGDPGVMVGLQRLDALTQTLDALAAYLVRLAQAIAAGAPLDASRAAEAVPLGAVALRLALRTGAPTTPPGECDLF